MKNVAEYVKVWEEFIEARKVIRNKAMYQLINDFSELDNFSFKHMGPNISIIYLNDEIYINERTNKLTAEKFLRNIMRNNSIENQEIEKEIGNTKQQNVFNEIESINKRLMIIQDEFNTELICGRSLKGDNYLKIGVLKIN